MKKTIDVICLIKKVNEMNQLSTCPSETRQGWNHLLEYVLFETDSYDGYAYLESCEVIKGEKTDDSRRYYYTKRGLR